MESVRKPFFFFFVAHMDAIHEFHRCSLVKPVGRFLQVLQEAGDGGKVVVHILASEISGIHRQGSHQIIRLFQHTELEHTLKATFTNRLFSGIPFIVL